MDRLEKVYAAVVSVTGNDGSSLVEVDGVDHEFCAKRRELLDQIEDDLNYWARSYRRRHGAAAVTVAGDEADGRGNERDAFKAEVERAYDESFERWEGGTQSRQDEMAT